jgi:hypothetical protein
MHPDPAAPKTVFVSPTGSLARLKQGYDCGTESGLVICLSHPTQHVPCDIQKVMIIA